MLSPGKILFELYYKPIGAIRKTLQTGIRRTAEINRGRKEMMAASKRLKEVVYPNQETFSVYFLTGKNYWFQTAFCLYSFQVMAGVNIRAYLIDDGSFDDDLAALVRNQFPTTTTIIRKSELLKALDEHLPESKFPVLRQRRIEYPHLRKLTDVHILPGTGPKLVLDSDMLFFQKPVELLEWMASPKTLLFMRDVTESYGYSASLIQSLIGRHQIPERVNVGVAGIPSNVIDWTELEFWTKELLKQEGSSYLQEQALTAMLAAGHPHSFLDESMYKVLPSIKDSPVREAIHHYVAEAKYDYFVKGWRMIPFTS